MVIERKLALRAKETSTVGPPTSPCRSRLAVLLGGGFSAPTVVSTVAKDRLRDIYTHIRARKTKTTFSFFLVIHRSLN